MTASGSPAAFVLAFPSVDFASIAGFVFLISSKNNVLKKEILKTTLILKIKIKKIENTNAVNVMGAAMDAVSHYYSLGATVVFPSG